MSNIYLLTISLGDKHRVSGHGIIWYNKPCFIPIIFFIFRVKELEKLKQIKLTTL